MIDIYWSSTTSVDRVLFIYGKNKLSKYCKKHKLDISMDKDGLCSYISCRDTRDYLVISIKKFKNIDNSVIGLIAHECTHAADYIMRNDNIEDMEFRAYLVQDMVTKALNYLGSK